VEIVTFTLHPGIEATVFARAAAALDPWLAACPGFAGRCLSRSADGSWTDHLHWADMAAAEAAAAALPTRPEAMDFLSAIAPDSVAMRHEMIAHRQTA
jgi:hypothetical protein